MACLLYLLEFGVPREKIELWHQDVDGGGEPFVDWPVTEEYVRITGQALGIKTEFQWREGGFVSELMREDRLTNPIEFTCNGERRRLPTKQGKRSTRKKFPAKSPDLRKRWCTPYLKIDVFRRALNNHPELKQIDVLVITGERWEESPARSRYLVSEEHPCSNKSRTVHWWRPVVPWPEEKIWEAIEKYRILPHPAYLLGWNRTSCMGCIFSTPDLWAMLREIAPDRFQKFVDLENELEFTLDNDRALEEIADMGNSRVPEGSERLVRLALKGGISEENFFLSKWELPPGALRGAEGGPT